jgi:hypothetical protein
VLLLTLAQSSGPVIVTLVDKPSTKTTLFDVVIASLGLTGVLVAVALVLGGVVAFALIKWHRRHGPGTDHLPPIAS